MVGSIEAVTKLAGVVVTVAFLMLLLKIDFACVKYHHRSHPPLIVVLCGTLLLILVIARFTQSVQ